MTKKMIFLKIVCDTKMVNSHEVGRDDKRGAMIIRLVSWYIKTFKLQQQSTKRRLYEADYSFSKDLQKNDSLLLKYIS